MSSVPPSTSTRHYWKQKISAYLHDSPNKALDILGHENSAQSLKKVFDFEADEDFRKQADFAASAADRLPWPRWNECKSDFDSKDNPFRHPLSGAKIELHQAQDTARNAEELSGKTMPSLYQEDDDEAHHRLAFLSLWRFWQNWASDADARAGFYPAETRLPDHTIWSHLGITSAMQGCYGGSRSDWDAHQKANTVPLPDHPAVLLFSIGPVQDFIAAARTTRDLWSGSYLLSYLIAHALKGIATDFGPDHVVFPNLKGQPLLDWRLKEDWEASRSSQEGNFWDSFDYQSEEGKKALWTPSLPNRFLALIPEKMTQFAGWDDAADYAAQLAENVKDELSDIAASISCRLEDEPGFHRDRFNQQVESLLEIHWQIIPLSESVDAIKSRAELLPNDENFQPCAGLDAVLRMVTKMPVEHRDKRYFTNGNVGGDDTPGSLNQPATAWPALYALAGWKLDGVKSLRAFDAPNEGTWSKGREHNKDSLTGREEACLIAPETTEKCEDIRKAISEDAQRESIKPNEFLGAATLIKRFWHVTHLTEENDLGARDFAMPNTHAIADHRPFDTNAERTDGSEESAKYYAVLALDGDQMGQWVSGAKCPSMGDLLSEEAKSYFTENGNAEFLKATRPLSPSFHLQFSEMLGNFSIHCARRIVEAFDGRLIYAGGDDVLAMLPADTAIDCAAALRSAFRGERDLLTKTSGIFQEAPLGCIRLREEAARKKEDGNDPLVSEPHRFPVLVPGPTTDVSCGIAIGHIKAPLQDLVKAAQSAEKRAKNELHRGACCVSLFKRSGEIHHWGFKWSDPKASAPVLPFFKSLMEALQEGTLTSRFPYKLIELLTPYRDQGLSSADSTHPGFAESSGDIVFIELEHTLDQSWGGSVSLSKENLRKSFDIYWQSLDTPASEGGRGMANHPTAKIEDFVNLLSTLAWINKHQVSEE